MGVCVFGKSSLKGRIPIFHLTCSAIYTSRLFWRYRPLSAFSQITEVDGTQLVVFNG